MASKCRSGHSQNVHSQSEIHTGDPKESKESKAEAGILDLSKGESQLKRFAGVMIPPPKAVRRPLEFKQRGGQGCRS